MQPAVHYHPEAEYLIDYGTGALGEAASLLVATHLALCPTCRRDVRGIEALSAAQWQPDDDAPACPPPLPTLAEPHQAIPARAAQGPAPVLPEPLRSYAGGDAADLPWRRRLFGFAEFELPGFAHQADVKLLRIPPGAAMPVHTHEGVELTLVLAGGFSDQTGHYTRGDVALADAQTVHRPRADRDGPCICLAVVEAPLRWTGPLARAMGTLAEPFTRKSRRP